MISILLPVLNAAHTIDHAIQSIIDQTFNDWELIIIDNASSDRSVDMVRNWCANDTRVKLLNESIQGIAYALNTGLKVARGKYIARMDADDWSHPMRLAKQIEYLEENPTLDVVSCQTKFESSVPKSGGYKRFVDWQNSLITPEDHYNNRFAESPVAHPTVMFRKTLIDELGPYSIEQVPEDYELWLRWMDTGKRFYKIRKPLLTWHDHAGRMSRNHPQYNEEAFFRVKGKYLKPHLDSVLNGQKIVACGTSKECRQRADWLLKAGVPIQYLTDVVPKVPNNFPFLEVDKIRDPQQYVILSLISKRGVWHAIYNHFTKLGFQDGKSLIRIV